MASNNFSNFLNKLSAKDPFMHWESGRMNCRRYNIHANKEHVDHFISDNVHLRQNRNQEVVGLCISEYGSNDIFGKDSDKICLPEEQDFSFTCHFENKRFYDLDQMDLSYTLEEGFAIQKFSELYDYQNRVALAQSAFNNTHYTEKNLKGLITSPDYIDEYNLSVISPDGQQVAYYIGWHDNSKIHAGYIEPVGTHTAFRKRGFAKVINKECFRRMKANGIKIVEIASRAETDIMSTGRIK